MKKIITTIMCEVFSLAVLASSSQSAESPFFAYLQDLSVRPSLVAFSPTNHDPRPGNSHRVPSRESLAADLQALRPAFNGLILYGYDKDVTPIVLQEAMQHGYRAVLLGIWDPNSRAEIDGTAELIQQYRQQLALAVCIGNEGIAFDRYTMKDVLNAIALLRQRLGPDSQVPVCTSEPFDEYFDLGLQAIGDFLCPNFHFVFEHPQKKPADAALWVRRLAMSLAEGAHKSVLVKETGIPHGGNDPFTPAAQQAFWGAYLQPGRFVRSPGSHEVWVSYAAAFEAFDLHWKADQSGMVVEEMWGLLSADRKPHPAFLTWEDAEHLVPQAPN